jgi:hypothetical protein
VCLLVSSGHTITAACLQCGWTQFVPNTALEFFVENFVPGLVMTNQRTGKKLEMMTLQAKKVTSFVL